jgi:ABC-type lipoprotein release transport system permease subunit
MFGRRGRRRGGGQRSRAKGCLLLVLLVIVVLIILSMMFGGFQKGTKSGSLRPVHAPAIAFASQFPAATWPGLS